jgi:hypothetical protein
MKSKKNKKQINEGWQAALLLGAEILVGLGAAGLGLALDFGTSAGAGTGSSQQESKLKEKKIGFKRGSSYDEEAADEFDDFAVEVGQLYQKMKNKTFAAQGDTQTQDDVDALAQEILKLIDKDTEGDLRTQFDELEELISSLPDAPTEKPKIGFKQAANELYIN